MGKMKDLDIERQNTVKILLNELMTQQALFAENLQDKLTEAYNEGLAQALNYPPFEELFEKLPTCIEGYNNNYGFQSKQNITFGIKRAGENYQCFAIDIDEPEFKVYRLNSDRIPMLFTACTAKDAVLMMINYLTENNLIQK